MLVTRRGEGSGIAFGFGGKDRSKPRTICHRGVLKREDARESDPDARLLEGLAYSSLLEGLPGLYPARRQPPELPVLPLLDDEEAIAVPHDDERKRPGLDGPPCHDQGSGSASGSREPIAAR